MATAGVCELCSLLDIFYFLFFLLQILKEDILGVDITALPVLQRILKHTNVDAKTLMDAFDLLFNYSG